MKTLSLLQPWASLVVKGAKKFETRSWNTNFRGPIFIHASAKKDAVARVLASDSPFSKHIEDFNKLPFGAIIGSAIITGTGPTLKVIGEVTGTDEFSFGDYSKGRYAWRLEEPVQFQDPYLAKGALGLWEFKKPICLKCGCTDEDCHRCIVKTGQPCSWVSPNICSACI
jgi:activating signal cointegrator 1